MKRLLFKFAVNSITKEVWNCSEAQNLLNKAVTGSQGCRSRWSRRGSGTERDYKPFKAQFQPVWWFSIFLRVHQFQFDWHLKLIELASLASHILLDTMMREFRDSFRLKFLYHVKLFRAIESFHLRTSLPARHSERREISRSFFLNSACSGISCHLFAETCRGVLWHEKAKRSKWGSSAR